MKCDKTPETGAHIYYDNHSCDYGCQKGCGEGRGWDMQRFPAAMAYVPMQPWENLYELEEGLCRGTVFPSLDLPFFGGDMK